MTPEQQDYFRRADDNLRAAELLLAEALFDISISRSYYAMFHSAKAMLLELGLSSKTHSGTIVLFNQHCVGQGFAPREAFEKLLEAERMRSLSDYGSIGTHFSLQDAQKLLDTARNFTGFLQQVLQQR